MSRVCKNRQCALAILFAGNFDADFFWPADADEVTREGQRRRALIGKSKVDESGLKTMRSYLRRNKRSMSRGAGVDRINIALTNRQPQAVQIYAWPGVEAKASPNDHQQDLNTINWWAVKLVLALKS